MIIIKFINAIIYSKYCLLKLLLRKHELSSSAKQLDQVNSVYTGTAAAVQLFMLCLCT